MMAEKCHEEENENQNYRNHVLLNTMYYLLSSGHLDSSFMYR
jgi:hypothetical protein